MQFGLNLNINNSNVRSQSIQPTTGVLMALLVCMYIRSIMVIEPSEYNFILKSYARFQNRVRFEVTSMINDKSFTARS